MTGSGARSIRGDVAVGAVNWPSAIWRARSFTLRNMVIWDDGGEVYTYNEQERTDMEVRTAAYLPL